MYKREVKFYEGWKLMETICVKMKIKQFSLEAVRKWF